MSLTPEIKNLLEQHQKDAQKATQEIAETIEKNGKKFTQETKDELVKISETLKEELEAKLKEQGTTIAQLREELTKQEVVKPKSIPEVLKENEADLKKIFNSGAGHISFSILPNADGSVSMHRLDSDKAAGNHATIANIPTNGILASVVTSIGTAQAMRIAGDNHEIYNQYRNNAFLLDLISVRVASIDEKFAVYIDELAPEEGVGLVTEGGTKNLSQYRYEIKSPQYKKIAHLLTFTDEFVMDFPRLYQDIMSNTGRGAVAQLLQQQILTGITAAATTYNTGASFGKFTAPNDWQVVAAAGAQVDAETFGRSANVALMNTYKMYNMGVQQFSTSGLWMNKPDILNGIREVGNPAIGADQLIVGDLTHYNLILRGGLIVKFGHNGTDFAQNKFSVVMEQFYYDYISSNRTKAIVKGTFTDIKAAITESND